jgi:hypothetical protein
VILTATTGQTRLSVLLRLLLAAGVAESAQTAVKTVGAVAVLVTRMVALGYNLVVTARLGKVSVAATGVVTLALAVALEPLALITVGWAVLVEHQPLSLPL